MKTLLLCSFTLAMLFPSITPSQVDIGAVAIAPHLARPGVNLHGIAKTVSLDNELNQELAQARSTTARYHSVEAAEADGYVDISFCEPAEGCHWLKPSLLDAHFNPAEPEVLLYVPDDHGRMRLVAVEYLIPIAVSPVAPEGFLGEADEWRKESEGPGLWELTVWIWLDNPDGIFAHHNPRVP